MLRDKIIYFVFIIFVYCMNCQIKSMKVALGKKGHLKERESRSHFNYDSSYDSIVLHTERLFAAAARRHLTPAAIKSVFF